MKIKSATNESFVEIVLARDNADAPQCVDDVAVDVEVRSAEGFYGRSSEVWFRRSDLYRFFEALEQFELMRQGTVVLSASPMEIAPV